MTRGSTSATRQPLMVTVRFTWTARDADHGEANYRALTEWCRNHSMNCPDLVRNPDAVNTDPWQGLGPLWFWDTNRLNVYADRGDIEMITRRINGGINGLADRVHH